MCGQKRDDEQATAETGDGPTVQRNEILLLFGRTILR